MDREALQRKVSALQMAQDVESQHEDLLDRIAELQRERERLMLRNVELMEQVEGIATPDHPGPPAVM